MKKKWAESEGKETEGAQQAWPPKYLQDLHISWCKNQS